MNNDVLDFVGFREYLENPYVSDWLDYQVWVLLKLYFMPYKIINKAV